MCGRFTLRTAAASWTQQFLPLWTEQEIAEAATEHAIAARYNIAPTQRIVCIYPSSDDDRRQWSMMRWGLVPSWAKDLSIGSRMINARSETAHEKNSFKSSLAKRRCIIPADGYYEWTKTEGGKQPHLFEKSDGGTFAMAGLWAVHQKLGTDGFALHSCTILTTSANQAASEIHDRMPVLLDDTALTVWMDPSVSDTGVLRELMQPAPDDLLTVRPVSKSVNYVKNDSPECVQAPSDS